MLAVHFGAGNIGRGFIGKLLADAGYELIFADVNQMLIKEINEKKQYTVHYAEEEQRTFSVKGIKGLHSQEDEQALIEALIKADLVTTAVGAHILPHIAPVIAKGLELRFAISDKPLNIIACENAIGGTEQLKEAVFTHLNENTAALIENLAGFPNAAVDRIVPDQNQENILDVLVEPFFEWVVDKNNIKGSIPPVEGIHYVDDLEAFIERKLFTVNTGHALAAYIGYQAGLSTVQESLKEQEIISVVKAGLKETGTLLCRKHGFDEAEHEAYINKILGRFSNPFFTDNVTRVARQPIKKLGFNERLISPARQLTEIGVTPENLIKVIAAALKYDYEEDSEAVALQKKIASSGVKAAFCEISGLTEADELTGYVVKTYKNL